MAREKKNLPQAVAGGAKERHKRLPRAQFDPKAPMPTGFEAKPTVPRAKSKHHTYFEFVQNEEKKKKLEFQVTTRATPPPGFEFVPIGNPALTKACKELSREKDAMIFIVSNTKEIDPSHLSHHVHRTGHHIREAIVEEARATLEHIPGAAVSNGLPEPLPSSQEEYTAQANAAILDLFPRIPHTDRQAIIIHGFNLSAINQRPKPVGLCTDMTLSRRVQLAVLAHIRHNHTRYDELLKETSWQNARKVVEALCLDILVKWRGDEETGRDQLDEILREVVVISDSDSDESEPEDDPDTEESSLEEVNAQTGPVEPSYPDGMATSQSQPWLPITGNAVQGNMPTPQPGQAAPTRATLRKEQRGFKRYRAWEEALQRNRGDEARPALLPPMERTISNGPRQFYSLTGNGPVPVVASRVAGSVPEPNGFVQPRPYSRPSSLAPKAGSPSAGPIRNRVVADISEQGRTTPGLSRHVSPQSADPFQDLLVPSVEPASPDAMQPAFVRALPPRYHPPSQVQNPVAYRPGSASPPREMDTRDRPFYVERPSAFADPVPANPVLLRRRDDAHWNYHASRLNDQVDRPVYVAEPRASIPSSIPARRAIVDPGRPATRENPVLMEDRGGFFERVHEQPGLFYVRGSGPPVTRSTSQDMGRGADPHRVVNVERPSQRVLHNNVEVMPLRSPPRDLRQPVGGYPPQHHQHPEHWAPVYRQTQMAGPRQELLSRPHNGPLFHDPQAESARFYHQPAVYYQQGVPDGRPLPRNDDDVIVLD